MRPWSAPERRRHRRHGWLFLTPEVEREVPALLHRLDAGGPSLASERALVGALVVDGDERRWFGYLRGCRARLEAAVRGGADPAIAVRLAAVLREQYLLAPSVHELDAADRAELEALSTLERRLGQTVA